MQEGGLVYLKEIAYKSKSPAGLQHAFRLIKELQKRYRSQEAERKEMEACPLFSLFPQPNPLAFSPPSPGPRP